MWLDPCTLAPRLPDMCKKNVPLLLFLSQWKSVYTFHFLKFFNLLLVICIKNQMTNYFDMTSVLVLLLLLLLLFFNLSSLTWCCLIFTSESVMPAKATLFNIKCESLFDFGTGPRNDVFYNPHGNNILKRDMLSRISGKSVILNWYFYLTIFNITTIGHNYCY